jgi:hypothetical protein
VNPDGFEMGSNNRIVQTVLTDEDAVLEIFPDDFYGDPVPLHPDMSDADLKDYKTNTKNYLFPQGVILAWHQHSPGEKMIEADGLSTPDSINASIRPRMYQWSFRDDRSRMLGKAIRQLELQNNVKVTGSLQVVNLAQSFATGLGYVKYPNREVGGDVMTNVIATVSRVTYELREGFTATLELTREEARFGQPVKTDKEKMNQISGQMAAVGSVLSQVVQKKSRAIDQDHNSQKAAVNGVLY